MSAQPGKMVPGSSRAWLRFFGFMFVKLNVLLAEVLRGPAGKVEPGSFAKALVPGTIFPLLSWAPHKPESLLSEFWTQKTRHHGRV